MVDEGIVPRFVIKITTILPYIVILLPPLDVIDLNYSQKSSNVFRINKRWSLILFAAIAIIVNFIISGYAGYFHYIKRNYILSCEISRKVIGITSPNEILAWTEKSQILSGIIGSLIYMSSHFIIGFLACLMASSYLLPTLFNVNYKNKISFRSFLPLATLFGILTVIFFTPAGTIGWSIVVTHACDQTMSYVFVKLFVCTILIAVMAATMTHCFIATDFLKKEYKLLKIVYFTSSLALISYIIVFLTIIGNFSGQNKDPLLFLLCFRYFSAFISIYIIVLFLINNRVVNDWIKGVSDISTEQANKPDL
ncbi:hypothetical protein JWG39_03655 [Desulforhopalus vacuolatus]|uniref:hypothetical protein n=1 Tax=Desulforhopalus vacuolatus TaxID=40414 RepID=UPI00196405CC|nr:hypothetical protein [Desulforhopalus vacuolatus]MBM9518909.1 hypothetical protein [Desulforhopalus vacuolatus]